jgi:predicted amidohydrolase
VGKIGIGLCFEHLNPLYRKALSLLGEEIHCALWVNSEDIKHIVDCSSRVTAIESGTHVALASQIVESGSHLAIGQRFLGGSGVIDPWGQFISGPVFGRENIVCAEICPEKWRVQMYQSKGVEARDDLLSLNIAREPYQALHFIKK